MTNGEEFFNILQVHFDDDQWELKRSDRLKWNAVPTIFHKRFKYTKRRERARARKLHSIQGDLPYGISQDRSDNQLVYIIKIEDSLTGTIDSLDASGRNGVGLVSTSSGSGNVVECNERLEFSSQVQRDSEKDAIIAELRKEIAEKDSCLLKYEKIICQMNSHLDKLKGRLKFWRDFRERDKFNLRKVRKVHK